MGRAFSLPFLKEDHSSERSRPWAGAGCYCEAKRASTLCTCHPTYTPGYTLNKGVSRGVRRVACTQGAGALPRRVTPDPKERRRLPRGQPELPKDDYSWQPLKGRRTIPTFTRNPNGISWKSGYVGRPQKGQKDRLQQYKLFKGPKEATKWSLLRGIPTGFRGKVTMPTPSDTRSRPPNLSKPVKTARNP